MSVSNGVSTDNATEVKMVAMVAGLPLSEIGKASRFGDPALSGEKQCSTFEVVLRRNEKTACPACARNPKRARLPAHARGCFGLN
jgi:hypothetical protein